jgi:hypothetical protein
VGIGGDAQMFRAAFGDGLLQQIAPGVNHMILEISQALGRSYA